MTVYHQHTAKDPVEKITADQNYFGHWSAQSDQLDVCEDSDCSCHGARVNRWFPADSEAKAIIGLIQEHYESRSDLR